MSIVLVRCCVNEGQWDDWEKSVYVYTREEEKKKKKRFALLFTHHITKVKPPDCCLALKHSHSRSQLMQVVEKKASKYRKSKWMCFTLASTSSRLDYACVCVYIYIYEILLFWCLGCMMERDKACEKWRSFDRSNACWRIIQHAISIDFDEVAWTMMAETRLIAWMWDDSCLIKIRLDY